MVDARLLMSIVCASAVSIVALTAEANWPQWRGPDGQGVSSETHVPTEWAPDRNVVWKTVFLRSGSKFGRNAQNVTPALIPKVRGAPLSPMNPEGAKRPYANATGMYFVSNAFFTHASAKTSFPRIPPLKFASE